MQLKSLLHLGQNVITFRTLLHLGQNVITFRTLLHLGSFITFRPSTPLMWAWVPKCGELWLSDNHLFWNTIIPGEDWGKRFLSSEFIYPKGPFCYSFFLRQFVSVFHAYCFIIFYLILTAVYLLWRMFLQIILVLVAASGCVICYKTTSPYLR